MWNEFHIVWYFCQFNGKQFSREVKNSTIPGNFSPPFTRSQDKSVAEMLPRTINSHCLLL